MALGPKDYDEIRKELDSCEKPLIFMHDDPDGLTSFLLLRRYMGKGKGVMVKSNPKVDEAYLKHVREYNPDKIFIVDIALVTQEFLDRAGKPVIWIDHHQPLKLEKVKYYNPMSEKPKINPPASYICYQVVRQDLWLAMIGIVGDWHLPEFAVEYSEKYPDLLPKGIKKPQDAMFSTKLGELIRIFAFNLKGLQSDAYDSIRKLVEIDSPYEILEGETPASKTILKRYERFNKTYKKLVEEAQKMADDSKFVVYTYKAQDGLSSEVSNEILYRHPDKVIIIGREKDGEMRMSLRGSGKNKILPAFQKAITGLDGYGGGHEYACGAGVKLRHFDIFLEKFKEQF